MRKQGKFFVGSANVHPFVEAGRLGFRAYIKGGSRRELAAWRFSEIGVLKQLSFVYKFSATTKVTNVR